MTEKKILCITGPTACGKTTLGILAAQHFGGEVISCDSMQIYAGMSIGTAAPTAEECQGIAHHMVGVIPPEEDYSVARYAEDAASCVDDVRSRGKLPIVVGGTGLYMDALLAGHGFAAGRSGGRYRAELARRLETEGIEPLRAELAAVDPESAARIAAADVKRTLRALEVYYETGETMTQHHAQSQLVPPRYRAEIVALAWRDREKMKAAIDYRVDLMLEQGLLDEVRALIERGVPRGATALQAIGYRECIDVIDGVCSLEEAVERIKLRSRQYAKRQLTWLRRRENIHWFFWEEERNFSQALQFVAEIDTTGALC